MKFKRIVVMMNLYRVNIFFFMMFISVSLLIFIGFSSIFISILVDDGVVLRVVSCKVSFDSHEDLAPAYLIEDEYVCDTDKT